MTRIKALSLLAAISVTTICVSFTSGQPGTADGFLNYLFAAYTITWTVFFGYLVLLSRKQRDLTSEIETLKKSFAEREDKTGKP